MPCTDCGPSYNDTALTKDRASLREQKNRLDKYRKLCFACEYLAKEAEERALKELARKKAAHAARAMARKAAAKAAVLRKLTSEERRVLGYKN